MTDKFMIDESSFHLDKRLIQASFEQAASRYDEVAVLQREVGNRLLERLDLMRIKPTVIVDVGCGTGVATAALLKKYTKARLYGLDLAPAMVAITRSRTPWFRKLYGICGDAESLPLADASCDMVFSNMTLQWCGDIQRVFREWRRVLKPGGVLMFSTLGPDTLTELRQSWQAADAYHHVNGFIDMHDIGDALIRTQLAEPVMDAERFTLTYPDVFALMRDLKVLGAHNVAAGRARSLTGKGRLRAMQAAYETFRCDGLLPASYEVVYGHAWAPSEPLSQSRDPGVAVFPVSQLRRRGVS